MIVTISDNALCFCLVMYVLIVFQQTNWYVFYSLHCFFVIRALSYFSHCFCHCQIHVSGAGDFQLSKIDVLNDPFPVNTQRRNSDMMESEDFRGPVVFYILLIF